MFHIEPLRRTDWVPAMRLALARVADADREDRLQHAMSLLAGEALDPRGIFVARSGPLLAGVQVCVALAGNACFFWLPVAQEECAEALVRTGLDWARSNGCKIAQATAHAAELVHAAPLLGAGFHQVTRLCQLEHDLRGSNVSAAPALRFDAFRPALQPEFLATLESTYDGTLDCPELNGARSMDEILAGHRGQGKFNPDFWWLARIDAQPIGVVMLAEMLDGLTWELAYLGVVPAFRRRGLARAMMRHALDVVRNQIATRLTLAVDARNTPALDLYRSLGFVETETTEVLLYFFSGAQLCQSRPAIP
ncbi:MAG: GNAT family N-acetyltransferase [Planctomycetes bacterium]|nr:GNAT family N-acetyltransferase [Planctomycetota bacterium]